MNGKFKVESSASEHAVSNTNQFEKPTYIELIRKGLVDANVIESTKKRKVPVQLRSGKILIFNEVYYQL